MQRGAEPVTKSSQPERSVRIGLRTLRSLPGWLDFTVTGGGTRSSRQRCQLCTLTGIGAASGHGTVAHRRASVPRGWEVANSLKISGDSETGNEEQHISRLQFCGKGNEWSLAYQLGIRLGTAEPGMLKGCGPTCLQKAREAFRGQGELGPEAWADSLERMLLCQ